MNIESRFPLFTYTRDALMDEANALAGPWVASWLATQPDEALREALQFTADALVEQVELWQALRIGFVKNYSDQSPQALELARRVDPTTAAAQDEERYVPDGFDATHITEPHYFNAASRSVHVPHAVMELAWPEHRGEWDTLRTEALKRGRVRRATHEQDTEVRRRRRFCALRESASESS